MSKEKEGKRSVNFGEENTKFINDYAKENNINFTAALSSLLSRARKIIEQEKRIEEAVEKMKTKEKFHDLVAEAAKKYSALEKESPKDATQ